MFRRALAAAGLAAAVAVIPGPATALTACSMWQSGSYAVAACYRSGGSVLQRVAAGAPSGAKWGPCVGIGQRSTAYIPFGQTATWIISVSC